MTFEGSYRRIRLIVSHSDKVCGMLLQGMRELFPLDTTAAARVSERPDSEDLPPISRNERLD